MKKETQTQNDKKDISPGDKTPNNIPKTASTIAKTSSIGTKQQNMNAIWAKH